MFRLRELMVLMGLIAIQAVACLAVYALGETAAPLPGDPWGFVAENAVNENTYVPGEYVCWNFACDLMNDALDAGFDAGVATVVFDDGVLHVIAVFDYDDGRFYIEAQSDQLFDIDGEHVVRVIDWNDFSEGYCALQEIRW